MRGEGVDCQYATGDEFASTYGWEWRNRGRDIGIFAAFVVVRPFPFSLTSDER